MLDECLMVAEDRQGFIRCYFSRHPITSGNGGYVINKLVRALSSVTQAHWQVSAIAMLTMAVGFVHVIALLLILYVWPLGDDYFRFVCILDNPFVDCLKDEWLYRSG